MSTEAQAQISGVRTVGIPVANQDRALEFYTDILGLEKRLDVPLPQPGVRWIEVAPPKSETTIALVADELLRWEGIPPMFAFRDPDGNKLEIVGNRS